AKKVRIRIAHDLYHGRQVRPESNRASVPLRIRFRAITLRPVAGRPLRRYVVGVTRKLEDIPLADPDVFQQTPGSVGQARRLCAAQMRREIAERLFEREVCSTLGQKVDKMLAQRGF